MMRLLRGFLRSIIASSLARKDELKFFVSLVAVERAIFVNLLTAPPIDLFIDRIDRMNSIEP